MRSRFVVLAQVPSRNASQVLFTEDDHVVKAFPPDGTDDALDIRFCHGERGAMSACLIPRALTRRVKSRP